MSSRTKTGCLAEHSGILSLPDELLAGILKLLPFQAKVQAEAICKRLNTILSTPLASELVWDTINLCDVSDADHRQFGRWLINRRSGIRRITYKMSTDWLSITDREIQRAKHQRTHERVALQLIPLIAGIAPEMHLELHKDVTARILGSPGASVSSQYWSTLACSLQWLALYVHGQVYEPAAEALNCLNALRVLHIACYESSRWEAYKLALPQLRRLYVSGQFCAGLTLDCPKLEYLELFKMRMRFSGLGTSLRTLIIADCLGLHHMTDALQFPVWELSELRTLRVITSHVVNHAQFLGNISHLTNLTALNLKGMPATSQALPAALPSSLKRLELNLEQSAAGIPEAAEALPKLQNLVLHMSAHSADLCRSLKPFVAMTALQTLTFSHDSMAAEYIHWMPRALEILGQALVDISEQGSRLSIKF